MNTDEDTNQANNVQGELIESYVKMSALDIGSYYYSSNYDVIARYVCNNQKQGHKVFVDQEKQKPFTCRFCGKTAPEVSFKNVAHALSELIGNKSVFLKCECDSCNKRFGRIYENHLANYLGPYRTLCYTDGKNGIPSYKTGDGKFRIDVNEKEVVIQEAPDKCIVNTDNEKFIVNLPRNKYISLMVFKSFVFMALSIVPEEELSAFQETISWLNSDQDDLPAFLSNASYATHVNERFVEGNKPLQVQAWVIRRKKEKKCPYAFLILEFDNLFYQVSIPCLCQDKDLANEPLSFPGFPSTIDVNPRLKDARQCVNDINLSSLNPIIGETVELELKYDFREEMHITSPAALDSIVSEKGVKPLKGLIDNKSDTNDTDRV